MTSRASGILFHPTSLPGQLGLDTSSRMNLPGTSRGNWEWRLQPDMLTPSVVTKLREITQLYERNPYR